MARVSVIIPVRDDEDRLCLCLDALSRQDGAPPPFEVIVVDNGSRVPPRGAAERFPSARFLREERPGSYAARNRGLAEAVGEILAFTDADCIPEPRWLSNAVAAFDCGPTCGAVAGRIDLFARNSAGPTAAELYEFATAFEQRTYVTRFNFGATANLFVRRAAIERVGAFDATLLSGGDRELCNRIVAGGFALRYADDVVVRHPARASLEDLIHKRRRVVGGLLQIAPPAPIPRRPLAFLRWVTRVVLPDLPLAWRVSRHTSVRGLAQRCRVVLVFALVHYVRVLEKGRLRLGAPPIR